MTYQTHTLYWRKKCAQAPDWPVEPEQATGGIGLPPSNEIKAERHTEPGGGEAD